MEAPLEQKQAEPAEMLPVDAYLPFVRKVATRIARRLPRSVEVDDLVSAGTVGLLEAMGRYDAAGGRTFETYAEFRIKGAIYDDLRRIDPVKRSTRAVQARIAAKQAELTQLYGRTPDRAQLAQALSLEPSELDAELVRASRGETSLSDEGQLRPSEQPDPEQIVSRRQQIAQMRGAVGQLSKRQQVVLNLYYVEEQSARDRRGARCDGVAGLPDPGAAAARSAPCPGGEA